MMRHHGYGHRRGTGRRDFDEFEGPGGGFGRRGPGMRGFGYGGFGYGRPSTRERIEHLEEVQRDLEEMTADVASHLAWLRQREAEQEQATA